MCGAVLVGSTYVHAMPCMRACNVHEEKNITYWSSVFVNKLLTFCDKVKKINHGNGKFVTPP